MKQKINHRHTFGFTDPSQELEFAVIDSSPAPTPALVNEI